jgi:hypothetical protein
LGIQLRRQCEAGKVKRIQFVNIARMYKNASRFAQHYASSTGKQPEDNVPLRRIKKRKNGNTHAESDPRPKVTKFGKGFSAQSKMKKSRPIPKRPPRPSVPCHLCGELTTDLHDHIKDKHGADALVNWIINPAIKYRI